MSIMDLFRLKPPQVEATAHAINVGEPSSDLRVAYRIAHLYDWFAQKPNASAEKKGQMRESLNRHTYILAGRGHGLCKSPSDVAAVIAKLENNN